MSSFLTSLAARALEATEAVETVQPRPVARFEAASVPEPRSLELPVAPDPVEEDSLPQPPPAPVPRRAAARRGAPRPESPMLRADPEVRQAEQPAAGQAVVRSKPPPPGQPEPTAAPPVPISSRAAPPPADPAAPSVAIRPHLLPGGPPTARAEGAAPRQRIAENPRFRPPDPAAAETCSPALLPAPPHHRPTSLAERSLEQVAPPLVPAQALPSPTYAPGHDVLAAPEEPNREPAIHVTIGRVEVRAVPAPPPAPTRSAAPAAPRLTLEDYLRERNGGGR